MTGKEAVRRLRAAGWQLARSGKHTIMEKDGQTMMVPLGAKIGRRTEQGILRVLAGRPNGRDGFRNGSPSLAAVVLVLVTAFSACGFETDGVIHPDGAQLADAGGDAVGDVRGDETGKQTEHPPVDGGGVESAPDSVPGDAKSESPPSACDPVANTGCAAPLKCGYSCEVGGFTCMKVGFVAPLQECTVGGVYYPLDDRSCGAGFGCAWAHCYHYCDTDADCAGTSVIPTTCKLLPPVPVDAGECDRADHKFCLP